MKRLLYPVVTLLFAIMLTAAGNAGAQGMKPETKIPALKAETIDGKKIDSTDFGGKVVILHFWHAN